MKKLLFAFVMMLSISLNAQNHVTIYGNVGVERVNISVLNTDYGTSSDIDGNYKLLIFRAKHKVGLLYSCVGYQDTLIMIKPEQMSADSLRISFNMRKISYMLDEVPVSAEVISRYREPDYVLMDFDISNDKFFILQRQADSFKKFRILVTNSLFNALDTIPVPDRLNPEQLIKDCDEQCQLVCKDTVYQIVRLNYRYSLKFPTERSYFMRVLQDCLFVTDDWIYIQETDPSGYRNVIYRLNIKSHDKEILFTDLDNKTMKDYYKEMNFIIKEMSKESSVDFGVGRTAPIGAWNMFIKKAWFHPKTPYLGKVSDTLYYFNHNQSVIEAYNEKMELLGSCAIKYPEAEDFWHFKIYQDKAFGRFYTIFGDKLNEIDVKTGKTYPKVTVNNYVNQKVIIHKGAVYTLKRRMDSGNKWVSYIDRIKL